MEAQAREARSAAKVAQEAEKQAAKEAAASASAEKAMKAAFEKKAAAASAASAAAERKAAEAERKAEENRQKAERAAYLAAEAEKKRNEAADQRRRREEEQARRREETATAEAQRRADAEMAAWALERGLMPYIVGPLPGGATAREQLEGLQYFLFGIKDKFIRGMIAQNAENPPNSPAAWAFMNLALLGGRDEQAVIMEDPFRVINDQFMKQVFVFLL